MKIEVYKTWMNELKMEKCKNEQTEGGEMNENGKMYDTWMNVLKGKWINKQCTYKEEMGNDCIKREGGGGCMNELVLRLVYLTNIFILMIIRF